MPPRKPSPRAVGTASRIHTRGKAGIDGDSWTDFFCGAGGSSIGIRESVGKVRIAVNHNIVSLKTHAANFPKGTKHIKTDISKSDPRAFPTTANAWFSPTCTYQSVANGVDQTLQRISDDQLGMWEIDKIPGDEVAERSRATMFDVCRFAEVHRYELIIVENVPEVKKWGQYKGWMTAMTDTGYDHQEVYLNSRHALPTPQSRDRIYVCFWKRGNNIPDLEIKPQAWCPTCERIVNSVQTWKKRNFRWGKYKKQYVYCCPHCAKVVEPFYFAAANALDFDAEIHTIGARKDPKYRKLHGLREISENTRRRVQIGLDKFYDREFMLDYVHTSRGKGTEMVAPVDGPLRTQLNKKTHALVAPPFTLQLSHTSSDANRVNSAFDTIKTVTSTRGEQSLVIPPFLVQNMHAGADESRVNSTIDPTHTLTTARGEENLVMPPGAQEIFITELYGSSTARGIEEPLGTQLNRSHNGVVMPFLLSIHHEKDRMRPVTDPMPTVISSGMESIILPPGFMVNYYGSGGNPKQFEEPIPTLTTIDGCALVMPPRIAWLLSYYNRGPQAAAANSVYDPLTTIVTRPRHQALIEPGARPEVDDCGYRGLLPKEVQRGMAFPNDYIMTGTQNEIISQLGNAVTPPVAALLAERMFATLQ